MTNEEIALKFAKICGLKEPSLHCGSVWESKLEKNQVKLIESLNPTNTDDVLKLATEWCKKQGLDARGSYMVSFHIFTPYINPCGDDYYYCDIFDNGIPLNSFNVRSDSLPQAIMQCIIKAAEAI